MESLEALHGELAELFRAQLQKMKASGEPNASILSAARQFLKDNHIEGVAVPESPLGELVEEYPFEDNVVTPFNRR